MPKRSAGLLLYRRTSDEVEVFLVHPGGPIWAKKDKRAWTIPKGEYGPEEDPLAAACREFEEETGFRATGVFLDLGTIKQKSGKVVIAWAFEGDCDAAQLKAIPARSNGRHVQGVASKSLRWTVVAGL